MQTLPNLSPAVTADVFTGLCDGLPTPTTDTPEARAAREETAMAAVAALYPTDAFQALLAARIVGAEYQAQDCFRRAKQPDLDPKAAHQIRAQANALMRHADSGLRALQRLQAQWEKAEAERNPVAMERAGYHFKEVPTPPPTTEELPFEQRPEAEQYIVMYTDRAKEIRAHRGLPPHCTFGPPEPHIIEAIVTGTGPLFEALDHRPPPTV